MEKDSQIKSIIRGYSALSNLPDADSYLEVTVKHIKSLFEEEEVKSLEERKSEFIELLRPYIATYGKDMLNSFGEYWLEISPKGKKFRFEKEVTFDVTRRLNVWSKNNKKFSIANMLRK